MKVKVVKNILEVNDRLAEANRLFSPWVLGIVPALALWTGLTMKAAIGTSLLVIVLNCLAGFAGYAAHVEIQAPLVAGVAACAIAGSFVGSGLTRLVQPDTLRRAFAGFILAMAAMIACGDCKKSTSG